MIEGEVELAGMIWRHPVWKPRVIIPIANRAGVERSVKFTVDTGFTGWLTIPADVVRELDLQYLGTRPSTLANDEVVQTNLYLALVQSAPVVAVELDAEPLLGAAMMNECRLTVDFWEGGAVTIASRAELG